MTTYTDVFGGANIYPSEVTYSQLTFSANVTLNWPEETSVNTNLATKIMDISTSTAGLSIYMPDATKTGVGNTVLFNNIGSQSVIIRESDGTQIVTVPVGQLWQVYLTNNTTAGGTWRSLQYGAAVSQANASSLAGTGIVAVGTLLSQSMPVTSFNSNYTAGVTDRAKVYNWTGAAGTLTLPNTAAIGDNWFLYLRNSGTGAVVADPPGAITINGAVSLSFQPGESAIIVSDGSNYFTIGFGQSATFAFDYTVISVPGSGNYTLSGSELNRVAYRFTGVLTGNRNIIIPATVQQYWVDNATTGAFVFSISPSGGGASVNMASGARSILYCDGTNVVTADTSGVSLPITVAQGGTNAVTAGAALVNLGGSATGISLFTAATQAAAWAALGPVPPGTIDGGSF